MPPPPPPPPPDTRSTDLDDFEAEVAFVQHDDLVLVRAVVDHVPQREQRVAAGQHCLAPGGVALVADDQAAAVVGDGLVQDGSLLGLLQAGEVVLEVDKMVKLLQNLHRFVINLSLHCCIESVQHDKWKDKGAWQPSFPHLMQFEAHSDCRCHHLLQEVQVGEDPLVLGGDAEVAFKQGVEAVQEGFQAGVQRENGKKAS